MSGLTMLRLLLLMHFVLSAKCHNAPEEDFGALYDVTASTQTTGTSWRDLQPNITPTVNAEGAREVKELFDNGDRQQDLLTSAAPDGISSITDYDYASNEYVTTDSNDLLTSNESLLTVKWDAADAGGYFTEANLIQNQTEEAQDNIFENIQSNTRATEIQNSNFINDTETTNIDSVESIFEDAIENATNLSSEDISAIVDVDRIFSGDSVAFPNFSTVNTINFHNLLASERSDNYTSGAMKNTDETTFDESSGDEPLTLVTLINDPSLFGASNSTNHLQFENLEESSGDGPSKTESYTFSNNDSNSYERLSITTSESPSTTFSRIVDWIETEKTAEDFGKNEQITFSQYGYENWENSNGFEDELKSTPTISSRNILDHELAKISNENKSRVEATTLESMVLGHENIKDENEDVYVSPVIEVTSNTNLDSETSSINYFMPTENFEVLDGYKSTSQSGTESFYLESIFQNSTEELQVIHFNDSQFFTEQFNMLEKEAEAASIHSSGNHTNVLNLDSSEAEITNIIKEESDKASGENSGTRSSVLDLDSSEELRSSTEQSNILKEKTEPTLSCTQTTVFGLDMSSTLRNEVQNVNTETLMLTIESKSSLETPKNNIGEDEVSREDETFTTQEETETSIHNFDLDSESTQTNVPTSDVSTTPKNEARSKNSEATKEMSLENKSEEDASGDEKKFTEAIAVTDPNLSTTSEVQTENFDALEILTKTDLEGKSQRMSKKLNRFDAKDNIENSVNAEGTRADHSWPTQKNVVPDLELHGEYVYTDVETSKSFNDQNFVEYGDDVDDTETDVENSLVTEQNQIEQAFTLPNSVKMEEENKRFKDVTISYFDSLASTTEGYFKSTRENERTTAIKETPAVNVEENKTATSKLEDDFDDSTKSTRSVGFDSSNYVTENIWSSTTRISEERLHSTQENEGISTLEVEIETKQSLPIDGETDVNSKASETARSKFVKMEEIQRATSKLEDDFDDSTKSTRSAGFDFSNFVTENISSSSTRIFKEHSHSTQETERTSTFEVETEIKQSLPIDGETDVNLKESETVRSKFEDDSYMKNTFPDFEEQLEKNDSNAITEKGKLQDQRLDLWKTTDSGTVLSTAEEIINSYEIQTTENVQSITAREIKNDQEFTTKNLVDLTTLKVNQGKKDRGGEGLMESTTASSKIVNSHVMEEAVYFNRYREDITEKNTIFSVPHESENQSKNSEFKNDEEFSETTSHNDLIIFKADQDFMSHNKGIEVNTTNEDKVRSGEGLMESTTARDTTISFDELKVLEEDLNFKRNEHITEKSKAFSCHYENEDAIFENVSKANAENEAFETGKVAVTVTLNEDQKNEIEDEFSTTEPTTSYHIKDYVQKEVATDDSVLDELTEDFTERATRLLKEAEVEEVTVDVKVTTFRDDFQENFTFQLANDSEKEEDINITTGTAAVDVPSNIDVTTSPLNDKSETPTTEEIFTVEYLVSDLQNWKGSKEEETIAKKVFIVEDISLSTTLAPVTLSEEINKTYFIEESFSDPEFRLQQNAGVTENIQTTQGLSVKTISNSNFNSLTEEIGNRDNLTMDAPKVETEADHINTMMTDLIQESTSEENSFEGTSTHVPGNRELDFNNLGSLKKEVNVTSNFIELKSEVTMTVPDIIRKENLSEEDYVDSIEVKREGSVTKNTSEIEDQEDGYIALKKLEDQTTTVASDLLHEEMDEESMTPSIEADSVYRNQANSRKGKTFTAQVDSEANKEKEEILNPESIKHEKEDKSRSVRVMTGVERTTEVVNIIREEASEENSASTKTEFVLKNLEESTSQTEIRNTEEQELEITTSGFKLFNKVETNGRFLNPQLHLDEVSSNEEKEEEGDEDNNFLKRDRSSQRESKRNENVQLDSPVIEITTEKQLTVPENTTTPTNHHQVHSILNKPGKIFGEISKRIFQKYIDVATTEENTERNYIVMQESEEDNQMVDDDEWIQTNGFINRINIHRNLQNVNKTGGNMTEFLMNSAGDWEIVFDSRHRTNVDLNEIIITQKRDVIVRESVGGSRRKAEENLDGRFLNLNLCSSWIEQKNRSCLTSGGLSISYMFDNYTTEIPATANVLDSCNDKNHIIDVNWVINRTASGILTLQLHVGEVYYWINSVSFQLELSDKRHTQISVSDLVILETQVGDHMQGIINIKSTSDFQLLIHVIDLTSTTVDDCITKEAKVFLQHELVLIIGAAVLATIIVLLVAVLLLYRKFRTTTSAYKMEFE